MKRFVVPVVAGVLVFGAATAFAASLNVGSTSLASGNATVASCNANAAVTYTTAYDAVAPAGYKVVTAPVTSAVGCANLPFKVTLTGAANVLLAEATGTLDASGAGTATFAPATPSAALVTGVSVVVTG